jgi:hypothetical protein
LSNTALGASSTIAAASPAKVQFDPNLAVRRLLATPSVLRDGEARGPTISFPVEFSKVVRPRSGLVDNILRGVKPAGIPVKQATNFDPRINRKTPNTEPRRAADAACAGR